MVPQPRFPSQEEDAKGDEFEFISRIAATNGAFSTTTEFLPMNITGTSLNDDFFNRGN